MVTLLLLVAFLFLGLAVKQASYILMHGSVFESLRQNIRAGMEAERFGFEKLNELVTCKVCMTAQVAIWMVAIPGAVLAYTFGLVEGLVGQSLPFGLEVAILFWGGFLAAMALAAVAVGLWSVLEYSPARYERLEESHRQLQVSVERLRAENDELRIRVVSTESPGEFKEEVYFVPNLTEQAIIALREAGVPLDPMMVDGQNGYIFSDSRLDRALDVLDAYTDDEGETSFRGVTRATILVEEDNLYEESREEDVPTSETPAVSRSAGEFFFAFPDFLELVEAVEKGCRGIGCGFSRRRCRTEEAESHLKVWWAANRNGHHQSDFYHLKSRLDEALPDYFRNRWRHKRSTEKLHRFRVETYCRMQGHPM